MAKSSTMLVCVLVCAMSIGALKVQGQLLPGLPPLIPPVLPILSGLIPIFQGNVSCAVNATFPGTIPPAPFPNATIQLICGTTVVASAITNNNGSFSILLSPITSLLTILTSLLSNTCRLVVVTPLSACNASLPSTGVLTSLVQFVGSFTQGFLNFLLFRPIGFSLPIPI